MELNELKLYLRVDGDEDDSVLADLKKAAEEYLSNAGVAKNYDKELYKLAIKLLVSHWYENRAIVGKADKLAFSLDSIILQLKYTQEDETEVTL